MIEREFLNDSADRLLNNMKAIEMLGRHVFPAFDRD